MLNSLCFPTLTCVALFTTDSGSNKVCVLGITGKYYFDLFSTNICGGWVVVPWFMVWLTWCTEEFREKQSWCDFKETKKDIKIFLISYNFLLIELPAEVLLTHLMGSEGKNSNINIFITFVTVWLKAKIKFSLFKIF